jgi:hypothetical protein
MDVSGVLAVSGTAIVMMLAVIAWFVKRLVEHVDQRLEGLELAMDRIARWSVAIAARLDVVPPNFD